MTNTNMFPGLGGSEMIAEVSPGLSSHDIVDVDRGVRDVSVYTETPDFTSASYTEIVVVEGTGLLVFKDGNGTICGRRILEPAATATLATGTRYSYWATPGGVLTVREQSNPAPTSG
jgi:hypothetical protein